jgi:hypothetical protein
MKNIFKLASLFAIMLLFIISSCKKEEEIIEGCNDSSAMNFQSAATSNDGSCIFAYDIAQGVWNIDPCEYLTITVFNQSIDIPSDSIFPETIEITGEGEGIVSMDINGEDVLADVANDGVITIQDNQTTEIDATDLVPTFGALIGVIEVDITGSGTIVSDSDGDLFLTLSFDILGTPQSSTCEIEFSR